MITISSLPWASGILAKAIYSFSFLTTSFHCIVVLTGDSFIASNKYFQHCLCIQQLYLFCVTIISGTVIIIGGQKQFHINIKFIGTP